MNQRSRPKWGRAGLFAVIASVLGHAALLLTAWVVGQSVPDEPSRPASDVWAVSLFDADPRPSASEPEEQELPLSLPVTVPIQLRDAVEVPRSTPASAGMSASAGGMTAGGVGEGVGGSATFFRAPIRATSVVFLIDRSTSMGLSGGLTAAKREVASSLGRLPATAHFQVIVYNRDPLFVGGARRLQPATEGNVGAAVAMLEATGAAGGTSHVEALRAALLLQPDVLFLVTDADDLTPEQARSLTQLNGGRTSIHTLSWGRSEGSKSLRLLAEFNGGTHRGLADTD